MPNYATLKAAIQQVVKTNGNNEITGALLQQSLLSMINSLGAGYQFAGLAIPSTTPGTPDHNVFYIGGPGNYSNFGSPFIVPNNCIGLFAYNGTWTNEILNAFSIGPVYRLMGIDVISEISPAVCSNIGYYLPNGTYINSADYGHSGPIQISAGDKIIIGGVSRGMPFYFKCDSSGNFISATHVSTSINDVYEETFNADGYISVQGRVISGNDGIIVNGLIYTGKTLDSIIPNVKKFVATRGVQYEHSNNTLSVVLNTLFVWNPGDGALTTITDSNTYTLGSTRFLVLTNTNTIATRATTAQLLETDFMLLYYDPNNANQDIIGGALYADYIKRTLNVKIDSQTNINKDLLAFINVAPNIAGLAVKSFISPSVCHNIGYYSTASTFITGGGQGHSDPIQVLAGDKIIIGRASNNVPFFVKCDSGGNVTRVGPRSSGISDVLQYTFAEDGYIMVQGRINQSNEYDYNLVNGLIFTGQTIGEIANAVKYIKKYVAARGVVYNKLSNSIQITINTLFVFDVLTNSLKTITDNTTYTLRSGRVFLVITQNDTIATRDTTAYLQPNDFVLYYYDANEATKDINGGALYPDYIAKYGGLGGDVDDVPENIGVYNAIRKALQFANLKWTPVAANMPNNSGSFVQNQEYQGVVYSSVKEYNQFVFEDVLLETFMTAVKNPRSVLYTENVSAEDSRSALGRTYHGINCACFYGSVCSGLLTYAYGLKQNVTTYEFRTWDEMDVVEDQSAYGLKLGDAVWQTGHIMFCANISRTKHGVITDITIVENIGTNTKVTHFTPDAFNANLAANNRIILRYKKLYENRTYVPQTQFVTVEEETPTAYVYNTDICPNLGTKCNYNEGQDVVLNLRTDYATAGYTTIELYKNDVLLTSRSITGIDETFTGLEYGDYKARIVGSGIQSDYAYFKVVNASVTRSGDSFNFNSLNATPVYYEFCDLQGRRSYDIVGLSTHLFTDAELQAGTATPVSPVVATGSYKHLKVHFATDYGRVIKVIEWV